MAADPDYEIELLRSQEAYAERRMAELDVMSRDLAHLPFTIMVTPEIAAGSWALGVRRSSSEMAVVLAPRMGLPNPANRPPLGHVLIVAPDVARRMAGKE